jgi:hypothetical protein
MGLFFFFFFLKKIYCVKILVKSKLKNLLSSSSVNFGSWILAIVIFVCLFGFSL